MLHILLWGYRTANPPSLTHPGLSIIINNTAAEVEHSILTSCTYTLSSATLGQCSIITKHTSNELDIHDFYMCRQRVLMQYINSAVCFSEEQLSLTLRTLISDFNSEKLVLHGYVHVVMVSHILTSASFAGHVKSSFSQLYPWHQCFSAFLTSRSSV